MDPNGGINPSNPRLDGTTPVPQPTPAPIQPQPSVATMPNAGITPPSIDGIPTLTTEEQPVQSVQPVPIPAGIEEPVSELPVAKGGNKALHIVLIIVAILVVLGMIAGGYFVGYASGKTKGQNLAAADYQKKLAAAQEAADKDTNDTSSDTTDTPADNDSSKLTINLQDPKYVDETVNGEIGKQVIASDGLVLMVANIERNFKPNDSNYKLDSSKELVKVNFLMGNAAKDKAKDISNFNFRLEDSSGAQLTPENVANYSDKFDTVTLNPGSQAKGSIVYKVNKDEKPLKFVRSQTYRISNENREVTTKIVITVAK